jgi:hypothetical protein
MAITFVDAVEPALETSNSTTHSITSPAGILAGDFLLLFISYAGGTTTNSLTTNPIGFVKLGDSTPGSGVTSTVYYKQNCVTGDSSQVTTITCSATGRISKMMVRYRGVAASGSAFLGFAQQAALVQTSYTPPVLATTGANGVQVQCVGFSVTGQVANSGKTVVTDRLTAGPTPAAGVTKVAGHWTGSATTTGNNEAGVAHNLTALANGTSVGGTVWSPESPPPATTGNATAWTIVLAPISVASSVRPITTISSTGWSNVGAAASIQAALADDVTTTLAETTDGPSALVLEEKFPELSAQPTVAGLSKLSATGGSVSYLIQIRQGASTVICSKTVVVAATDGIVDDTLTSTTAEASAITDWTDLRMRWTATAI